MAKIEVSDFLDVRASQVPEGEEGVAGQATEQFRCPADQWWLIDAIAIQTNSVALSTLFVFVGGPVPQDEDLIDGSSSGDLDVSDRSSPIRVFPGQYVTFRWTGMTVGSVAKLHFQGRVLKRVL